MDIISILLFFIYSIIILGILVYVSPIISAIVMIIVPVVFILIMDYAVSFFSIMQFSYLGVQIYNLHILLFIWSAFIGVIAYAEMLTWYLLRESQPQPVIKESPAAQGEKPKTLIFEIKGFFQKLYKILKGEKIKPKP